MFPFFKLLVEIGSDVHYVAIREVTDTRAGGGQLKDIQRKSITCYIET
jgi:hypothetical protein